MDPRHTLANTISFHAGQMVILVMESETPLADRFDFCTPWILCVQSMQTATANEPWDIFLCDADNVYTLLTKMNWRSRCHLRLRYFADCLVPQWVICGELRPIQQFTHDPLNHDPKSSRPTLNVSFNYVFTTNIWPSMTLNYFTNIILIDGSVGHNHWPEWSSKFLI